MLADESADLPDPFGGDESNRIFLNNVWPVILLSHPASRVALETLEHPQLCQDLGAISQVTTLLLTGTSRVRNAAVGCFFGYSEEARTFALDILAEQGLRASGVSGAEKAEVFGMLRERCPEDLETWLAAELEERA